MLAALLLVVVMLAGCMVPVGAPSAPWDSSCDRDPCNAQCIAWGATAGACTGARCDCTGWPEAGVDAPLDASAAQ